MSLLDRVQKKSEEVGGQVPPVRPPVSSPGLAVAPPAPQTAGPAAQVAVAAPPAPVPLAPAAPAEAAPRPGSGEMGAGRSSLLTRTGLNRPMPGRPGSTNTYHDLRTKVHARLIEELASVATPDRDEVVSRITELVNEVVLEQGLTMTRQDKQRIVETVTHDVLGLGPLEALLADTNVTEIMINGPKQVYVEQKGKLTLSSVKFESNEQLMQIIDRIVSTIGRRIDESSPMVDARLKDGSRVNVIIPPLALTGPTVTIRKFSKDPLQVSDLVKFGSVTEDMVAFIGACVRGRLNVVVSGGTGSGKTTTLNVLSSFIPNDERIVTIEDAAELQLRQEHVISLETRPANVEGRGRVTIRDLVVNSLRMRPDRIVIGECRGGEALDMLQAMNTGHDGSLTTLHANSPKESIGRLETLVLMAGTDLPSRAIREQIASAVNIIVQQSRLRDGTRKIVSIAEVLGIEGDQVKLQEVFTFKQTGIDPEGKVLGQLTPTGVKPHFLEFLRTVGEDLPETLFRPVHVLPDSPVAVDA